MARPSDLHIVPCIDGDVDPSRAEAGGMSALLGMSEWDVMVTVVCLYFYRLLLSLVDASVSESFLDGTQDPELCAS